MENIKKIKNDLIEWNKTFPLDRLYRKSNNISFNSDDHRRLSQIDIYYDWLETKLFKEYETNFIEQEEKAELYKKGIWIKEQELTDDEFDQIEI